MVHRRVTVTCLWVCVCQDETKQADQDTKMRQWRSRWCLSEWMKLDSASSLCYAQCAAVLKWSWPQSVRSVYSSIWLITVKVKYDTTAGLRSAHFIYYTTRMLQESSVFHNSSLIFNKKTLTWDSQEWLTIHMWEPWWARILQTTWSP